MKKSIHFNLLVCLLSCMFFLSTANADFEKGHIAYLQQDYTTALKELQVSAQQGHASSQFVLGSMYINGQGVPQDDREAIVWFRKAAEQGNAEAQYQLGGMYLRGESIPQSYIEAANWFRKAAEQNNAKSQLLLGGLYLSGHPSSTVNRWRGAPPPI